MKRYGLSFARCFRLNRKENAFCSRDAADENRVAQVQKINNLDGDLQMNNKRKSLRFLSQRQTQSNINTNYILTYGVQITLPLIFFLNIAITHNNLF